MVGAWILVALIEWAASRADRRPEPPLYAPAPRAAARRPTPRGTHRPSSRPSSTSRQATPMTAVTRLPPPVDEIESTAERRPGG